MECSSVSIQTVSAVIDGLPVVSFQEDHSDFLRVISLSFDLLREHDPRRLERIISAAEWVVDFGLALGGRSGEFYSPLSAIVIDFELSDDFGDDLQHAAYYAGVLVHEGTHGILIQRGFEYTRKTCVQTERICRAEENRFLAKLNAVRAGLGDSLQTEFDPEDWEESWKMSRWESAKRQLSRAFEKD